jgi:Gluconate 2-dehydrogenase subunit 3
MYLIMDTDRRDLLKKGAALLSFTVGSKVLLLTPKQAYAKQLPFSTLSEQQATTLAALAEAIVPGAEKAGICHYIDQQLSAKPADSLLMIRYLSVPPPFSNFYRLSLASAQVASNEQFKQPLESLNKEQAYTLAGNIAQGKVAQWNGPPSPFFFFVLRADATDVVYGTPAGFDHLGVPYMPHILPEQRW